MLTTATCYVRLTFPTSNRNVPFLAPHVDSRGEGNAPFSIIIKVTSDCSWQRNNSPADETWIATQISMLLSPSQVLLNMKYFFVVLADFTVSCENPWRQITSCFVTLKNKTKRNPSSPKPACQRVVDLLCFLQAHSHSFQSVASRRLNYMFAWIAWNGLLIQPRPRWLKCIEGHEGWRRSVGGGGAANNGRRGNILPAPRPWRRSIKPFDSLHCCPVTLIYQPQTHRLWRSGWEGKLLCGFVDSLL